MALTWTLTERWLPELPLSMKSWNSSWIRKAWKNLPLLSLWYIQDQQCIGVSNSLEGVHGHGCTCLPITEKRDVGWLSIFFNVHKHFLGPDHVARQATEAERKLQTSHYDGEKKGWDWDMFVTLHKNNMPSWRALQIMATVKWTMAPTFATFSKAGPTRKYGIYFNATLTYLWQMVTKKGSIMQSIHIAKMGSHPAKP